jgi:hypothetical protein
LAARSYVPQFYPGRITLIVERGGTAARHQWEHLALGGLDVEEVLEGEGPLAMRPETGIRLKSLIDSVLREPRPSQTDSATRDNCGSATTRQGLEEN